MDIHNILVLDSYEGFASKLKAELEGMGGAFRLFYAKNTDTINEIRVNYQIECFLIAEEWAKTNRRPDVGNAIVYSVTDTREAAVGERSFCRSDDPKAIAGKLAKALNSRTWIVGVGGVSGGCGKTTAAIALAHRFAADGKKTFFLSIESSRVEAPFSGPAKVGLAEVLVALDEPENLEKTIAAACFRPQLCEGIDAFASSERNADRAEISAADVAALLAALKRMGQWDVIVVDMDGRMDDAMFEVWQRANRMVLAVPHTGIGLEKKAFAEGELEFRSRRGEVDFAKLVPVLTFYVDDGTPVEFMHSPIRLNVPYFEQVRRATIQQWSNALGGNAGVVALFTPLYKEVRES